MCQVNSGYYCPVVNMADAVAARREARRKRILENSHNRLQLISGKCEDDCPRESPTRNVIPEQIREVSVTPESLCILNRSTLNNGVILPETDTFDNFVVNHDNAFHDVAAGDGEAPDDLAAFTSPLVIQEPTQTSCLWDKVASYRYDIVLLSVIIQLLNCLTLVTFEDTYFFLPILVYVVTKIIWFPAQSKSKFSNALMLLQGVCSYKVQKMLYIVQCVGVISCDICIFLFTTICIQSLFITLKISLIT